MSKPRILIPQTHGDLIALAAAIQDQHTSLGKNSPLAMLDWGTIAGQIKEAGDVHGQIEGLNNQVEKLTEQRANLLAPLGDFVRSARDILSGVHRNEMRSLGDYGFKVDTTPKAKKAKTPGAAQ